MKVKFIITTLALTATLVGQTASAQMSPLAIFQSLGGGGQSKGLGGEKELRELRQNDPKDQCEAQNLGGVGGLMSQTGGLTEIVSNGLQQQMSQTVSDSITQAVNSTITNTLKNELPRRLEDTLSQQLPNYVFNQLDKLGSDANAEAALPGIVAGGIRTLLPRIIQTVLPQLLEQTLTQALTPLLGQRFTDQLPGIIQNSSFATGIGDAVEQASGELDSSVRRYMGGTEQRELTEGMINGSVQAATQGVGQSEAVGEFSQQISEAVIQTLLPKILEFVTSSTSGTLDRYAGTGSGAPATLAGLIDQVPGLGGDILNDLDLENTLKTLSNDIGNVMGREFATDIRGFQLNSVLNNATNQQILSGSLANNLNAIPGVHTSGLEIVAGPTLDGNPAFILNDFQAEGITNAVGADAADAVSNASTNISNTAVNGLDFGSIGHSLDQSLRSGLSGGLSGVLTGLTEGIPYAGPILAPFVQQLTTQLFDQLFGVLGITGVSGLPVSDVVVNSSINQVGRGTGETAANTKQSNKNEEEILKKLQSQEEIMNKICAHEKTLRRIMEVDEENRLVNDRNAMKASYSVWDTIYTFVRKNLVQSGRNTSQALSGVVGGGGRADSQPTMVPNLNSFLDEGRQEAAAQQVELAKKKNSGNIHGDEASRELNKAINALDPPTGSMSESDYKKTQIKEEWDKLTPQQQWTLTLAKAMPENNPAGLLAKLALLTVAAQDKAAREKLEQYREGNGIVDIATCPKGAEIAPGLCGPGGWQTQVTGSMIDYTLKYLTGKGLDFATGAKKIGEDFVASNPELLDRQVAQISNFAQEPESTASTQDPCPSPEPCPDSGWKARAQELSTQTLDRLFTGGTDAASNALDGLLDGSGNNQSNNDQNFDLPTIDLPPGQIERFDVTTNGNGLVVNWQASNTIFCQTDNTWSGTDAGVGAGNLLEPSGYASISNVPNPSVTYELSCYDFGLNRLRSQITVPPNTTP